jgi:hypothetical protein
MYIFMYLLRGFTLIWYLISPPYRQKTNTRWRRMKTHRLVLEIGTGVLGLVIAFALIALLIRNYLQ